MRLRNILLLFTLLGLAGCNPGSSPAVITSTPFQPVRSTATFSHPATSAPRATQTPEHALSIERWWGLDFSNESPFVRLVLNFADRPALEISFQTGWPCEYINHRACAGVYTTGGTPVLLLTVHSGLWGEAEPLRDHLEGMGINRAALPLDQIRQNLLDLRGLPVRLEQGDQQAPDLKVQAAVRVPPEQLEAYFSQPVPAALERTAGSDADFTEALRHPLLIIETCGWRHPDEGWVPGVSDTSASIYLLAIGKD